MTADGVSLINPITDDALPPTLTGGGWRVSDASHDLTGVKTPAKKPEDEVSLLSASIGRGFITLMLFDKWN